MDGAAKCPLHPELPEGRTKLQPTGIHVLQTHLLSSRQSGPARYF